MVRCPAGSPERFNRIAPPTGRYTQVSVGWYHGCALDADGALSCWGGADNAPMVEPTGHYSQISAGGYHNCAVREDGGLGLLGPALGTAQTDAPPGRYRQVSAGGKHNCAVRVDGVLMCWGGDAFGQTDTPSGRYTQVSAGEVHSCAVRENDAAVVCWGSDWFHGTALARGAGAVVEGDQGRIVARLLEDGRLEFGFQPHRGGERVSPVLRFVPVDARVGRWLRSSVVVLNGIELGQIVARRLGDRGVEVAWVSSGGGRFAPSNPYFALTSPGGWVASGAFDVAGEGGG